MKWFMISWYSYLFGGLSFKWKDEPLLRYKIKSIIITIYCRSIGHSGVTWYNLNGYEPDMSCIRCGDDLG